MKLLSRIIYKSSKILISLNLRKATILIIKLDGIGDYILFRNFIEELKKNKKFSHKRIVLCGNVLWREIALTLDSGFIDRFIWVEKNKIKASGNAYTRKIFFRLNFEFYETVIHPTYSRDYISEFLIQHIFSPNKITMSGDDTCLPKDLHINYHKNYKGLINVGKSNDFEFYKYKIFFEKFLERDIPLSRPAIILKPKQILYKNYVMVFIGASHDVKKWDYINYGKLIQKIMEYFNYSFILCGDKCDEINAEKIMQMCNQADIVNLAGETDMHMLMNTIAGANMLISNDTGVVHLAAALNISTFCLYRGEFTGRFLPYPEEINSSIVTIMKTPELIRDFHEKKEITGVPYNINDISVEYVFSVISKMYMPESVYD